MECGYIDWAEGVGLKTYQLVFGRMVFGGSLGFEW